ncbi:hypothetical protein P4O66_006283 [Electrophorus voltai]|uniref:Uncharacterized protein n=1 Tax=Electrophorus voltai TaxID=2609070 RepID=A0AAD8ZHX9_9TELE|nr:hypothetical protein P4O66_006283 [Electrophorus voltai]
MAECDQGRKRRHATAGGSLSSPPPHQCQHSGLKPGAKRHVVSIKSNVALRQGRKKTEKRRGKWGKTKESVLINKLLGLTGLRWKETSGSTNEVRETKMKISHDQRHPHMDVRMCFQECSKKKKKGHLQYTMNIYWSISVSKEGVIKPKIELLMKMPDQAQQMDSQNVMETAPECFRSLLMIFGVEISIECLIKTMHF